MAYLFRRHFLFRLFLIYLVLFALLTTGCRTPTPTPLPADVILQNAVKRAHNLQGFHFAIDRNGAPAYLNEDHNLAFARAEGTFYAPNQASATIRVITPGLVTEVSMIALGDEYWESDLLTREWHKLPPGVGFNPARLFDPQSGYQQILLRDTSNLQFDGLQELVQLPDRPLYTLSGRLDGTTLYHMSYGLIGPQPMMLHMWIDPQTFDVLRLQLDEPAHSGVMGPNGETSTIWQVDFWGFDQVTPVSPPPEG